MFGEGQVWWGTGANAQYAVCGGLGYYLQDMLIQLKGKFTLNDCYKIMMSDLTDPFLHFRDFGAFQCDMVEGDEIDMISIERWDDNEEIYFMGQSADDEFVDDTVNGDLCYVFNGAARDYMDLAMYGLYKAGLIEA